MSPDGSISSLKTRTPRPAKPKTVRAGKKIFASESLRVIVSGAASISTPRFLDP